MQLSLPEAPPSRARLLAHHPSPGLIACALATFLVLPAAGADEPPLSFDEALR